MPPGAERGGCCRPAPAPVRLHRRSRAPCTAPTRRPRLSAAPSTLFSSPPVSHTAASLPSPSAAGDADEPSVANRRTSLFLPASVPFLCRDPSRRQSTRSRCRPSAAASPLASPSPCRAHACPRTDRHGRAGPHFLPHPSLASPRPRHGLAVRGDHTPAPRCRVRVAADPLGLFPEHPLDAHPRTRSRRPHVHAPIRLPHRIRAPPHRIPLRSAHGPDLSA
jgi:hypothetical protein